MGIITNRRRVMGSKKLPYDAVVEYLKSTGTQWIDTGVLMESTYRMSVTFAITKSLHNQALFGARISYTAENGYTIWAQTDLQKPRIDLTNATNQYVSPVSSKILLNRMYTIERRGTSNYFDGVEVDSNGSVISYTPQYTAYLFAVNQVGTATFNAQCAVASCQIWDSDGALVRDFIPVRVGHVGYMYDRVSGQLFGNSGTGEFILGPDVSN